MNSNQTNQQQQGSKDKSGREGDYESSRGTEHKSESREHQQGGQQGERSHDRSTGRDDDARESAKGDRTNK